MGDDRVIATTVINAPAEVIFAVLADPEKQAAIHGTGSVRESAASTPDHLGNSLAHLADLVTSASAAHHL